MRRRFDSEYIESELRRVGRQLETELTVYLIGGGAMSFRGLKETTKDIDLTVTGGDDLRVLQAVLVNYPTLLALTRSLRVGLPASMTLSDCV